MGNAENYSLLSIFIYECSWRWPKGKEVADARKYPYWKIVGEEDWYCSFQSSPSTGRVLDTTKVLQIFQNLESSLREVLNHQKSHFELEADVFSSFRVC